MIKKLNLLLILFLTFTISFAYSQIKSFEFKLGLHKNSLSKFKPLSDTKIIVGPSTIIDGVRFFIQKKEYLAGFDSSKKIIYYSTRDTTFLINNFRYLTPDKGVIDSLKNAAIYSPDGVFIKLPEGWNLGFCEEDIYLDGNKILLKPSAIPCFLFKKDPNSITSNWSRKDKKSGTTSIKN